MKVDLSIIIVNYNKENLLEKCIASIYEETQMSFEVIIIDNGSCYNNLDLMSGSYENIIIKKNDSNRGFSCACNQGASIAKGRYFLFLNPDTIVLDGAIDKTYHFIVSNGENAIVGCKMLNFDGIILFKILFEKLYLCKKIPNLSPIAPPAKLNNNLLSSIIGIKPSPCFEPKPKDATS